MDGKKALGAVLFAGAFLDLVIAEAPRISGEYPQNSIGVASLSPKQSGAVGGIFDLIIAGAGLVLMS